jgi:hypothetical protein
MRFILVVYLAYITAITGVINHLFFTLLSYYTGNSGTKMTIST